MGGLCNYEREQIALYPNQNNHSTVKKNPYDCIQIINHHKYDVTCLIVLRDSRLVSGSVDSTVVLWKEDIKKKFVIDKILKGHTSSVISITEMMNKLLCSSSVDKTLRLWKLNTMKCLKILIGHEDSVLVSLQLLQRELIVSGSDDKTIRIWGLNKKKDYSVVKILEGHHKSVSTLLVIEKKDIVISGSDDGTVRIWSINQMICINMIDDFNKSAVYCVQATDRKLIVACGDGNVYIFMLNTLIKVQLIRFSKFGVIDFFIYPSGKIIGFACADGRIRVWKIGTKRKLTIKGHTGVVKSIQRLDDGRLVTCSQDKSIKIWRGMTNFDADEDSIEEEEYNPL